jgi:Zn-dependent peptidase ImmA (M78 family)
MLSDSKKKQIDKIVFDTLKSSKALGVYPTPVDQILKFTDLKVHSGIDLSIVPEHYFAKFGLALKRAVSKVHGALIRNDRMILLDAKMMESKKNFVKLHEIGHDLLFWQNKLINCLDDKESLDPDTKELFEAEANYFASAILFQQNLFYDKLKTLPLDIGSGMELAKKFGSSIHAALRRYVEYNSKRCCLLILNKEKTGKRGACKFTVRTSLQSPSFTKEFGMIEWSEELGMEWPFVADYQWNRKHVQSEVGIVTSNELIDCDYHFFNNSYNGFVFFFPKGEKIKSKTQIVITT